MKSDHQVVDEMRLGVLRSRSGESTVINWSVGNSPQTLVERGLIDCVIVETEDGFSQLGTMRRFLSHELGLDERNLVQHVLDGFPEDVERNISSLADWNRSKNTKVTLVAIPSERQGSHLKGLILVPHDRSESYRQYAGWEYGRPRPHRDFVYNVTYEAIAHAHDKWGSKRIAITHFFYEYHRDVTTCQVEAMAHFCIDHQGIDSFTFLFLNNRGGNELLEIVTGSNGLPDIGVHRPIISTLTRFWGIDFVNLKWPKVPVG